MQNILFNQYKHDASMLSKISDTVEITGKYMTYDESIQQKQPFTTYLHLRDNEELRTITPIDEISEDDAFLMYAHCLYGLNRPNRQQIEVHKNMARATLLFPRKSLHDAILNKDQIALLHYLYINPDFRNSITEFDAYKEAIVVLIVLIGGCLKNGMESLLIAKGIRYNCDNYIHLALDNLKDNDIERQRVAASGFTYIILYDNIDHPMAQYFADAFVEFPYYQFNSFDRYASNYRDYFVGCMKINLLYIPSYPSNVSGVKMIEYVMKNLLDCDTYRNIIYSILRHIIYAQVMIASPTYYNNIKQVLSYATHDQCRRIIREVDLVDYEYNQVFVMHLRGRLILPDNNTDDFGNKLTQDLIKTVNDYAYEKSKFNTFVERLW